MLNPRVFTALAAEQIDDDGLQWIELMPVGEKFRNGPWYFTVTVDDLESYAASIREKGDRTPIDYDHSYHEGNGTRAAGWFTGEAEVRGTGAASILWAEVQWTPAAVEAITSREFRFVSPEFSFEEKDSKTGLLTKAKEIVANTLTNRPFFKQLAALAAEGDLVWVATEGYNHLSQQLYAALNPSGWEDARYWVMDVAPGKALIQEYANSTTWVATFTVSDGDVTLADQGEWVPAEQEWVEAASAAVDLLMSTARNTVDQKLIDLLMSTGRRPTKGDTVDQKLIRESLGLPEDATDDAVTAALAEQKTKADKATELETELETLKAAQEGGGDDEVATLRTELEAEKGKRIESERETMLATAVRERRIVPAQKAVLAEQFGDNLDGLQAVLASFPVRSTAEVGSGEEGLKTGETKDAAEQLAGDGKTDDGEVAAHVRAEAILAEQGKTKYSADEYVAAYVKAERELAVTG